MLHAYRCEDYVIVTEANKEEFQAALNLVRDNVENWDVNEVKETLNENDFVADAYEFQLNF